jgi:hypothetical protein
MLKFYVACVQTRSPEAPPPLGGLVYLNRTFSMICDFTSLQNIHSRWVTGKYVFLNGLA